LFATNSIAFASAKEFSIGTIPVFDEIKKTRRTVAYDHGKPAIHSLHPEKNPALAEEDDNNVVILIVFWNGKHDRLPASLPLSPKDIDAPETVATVLKKCRVRQCAKS
jgi:hypothetical protein